MKALIVHAHENKDSFCSALCSQTQSSFSQLGIDVIVSDLYQQNFNPVAGMHDFISVSDANYYKYAMEQLHASKNQSFSDELQNEMQKLLSADILNFNFPLWWFDFPAILKGWVDRVLAYGVAYGGEYGFGPTGRFKGKKAFLTVTTGSPASNYTPEGSNKRPLSEIFRNINEGIFELIGFEVVEPFVAYAVSRVGQEEREKMLEDYKAFLLAHFSTTS